MLKSLINNQTIQVDAHQRGNRENIKWESPRDDIHIHKRTNWKARGKNIQVDIKVPINSERPVKIQIVDNVKKKDKILTAVENQLIAEIQKAFNDKEVRQAFIDDLIGVMDNYSGVLATVDRARQAIKQIAKHFGLDKKVEQETTAYAEKKLTRVIQTFKTPDNVHYFVNLNTNTIVIGQVIQVQLRDRNKRRR